MGYKERFIEVFKNNIRRDGSDQLLSYLERSDFFTAPASTRFHLSCEGGLCIHSLNVYDRLVHLLDNQADKERCFPAGVPDEEINETVAIAALLHDLCKIHFYQPGTRNVKNPDTGRWETVPTYVIDERFPIGHGEKTTFIIQNYMKLKPEEAIAIRWHMGEFDNAVKGGDKSLNKAWEKYPLGFMLHMADMMASHLDEVDK